MKKIIPLVVATTTTYVVLMEVATAYIEIQPFAWCGILGIFCP